MKKRIFSLLLALVMVGSLLPASAWADEPLPEDQTIADNADAPDVDPAGDEDLTDDEEDPEDPDKQPPEGGGLTEGDGDTGSGDPAGDIGGEGDTPDEPKPTETPDPDEDGKTGDDPEKIADEDPEDEEKDTGDEEEDEEEDEAEPEEEEDEAEPVTLHSRTVVNPLYVGVISEADIPSAEVSAEECITALEQSVAPAPAANGRRLMGKSAFRGGSAIYDSTSAAGEALKQALIGRQGEVRIHYHADTQLDWNGLCDQIYAAAIVHTGSPTEGDYLRYENGGYNAEGTGPTQIDGEDGWYYVFVYSPLYYTTAEQEAALDGAVSAVLAQLNLSGRDEQGKISAIYDYLTYNVSYDNVNVDNDAYLLKYTAYAALVNKTAVCQGFATAFYRLCLSAGVSARIISSAAMNHAWNIAGVNGTYYQLDATWDAGRDKHIYFMRGSTWWRSNHGTAATQGDQYAGSAFAASYPLAANDLNIKTYTITYNLNGGTNAAANPEVYYASSPDITLADAVRDGYRFDGWYSNAGLTNRVTVISSGSIGNRTLYAKWTAYTSSVVFMPNGGEGSMEAMTISTGETRNLPANTFTRAGFAFAGWNTKADGSGTAFRDGQKVKILSRSDDSRVTLYAQWDTGSYTVAFLPNGGTGTMAAISCRCAEETLLPANTFTFNGHSFTGWNTRADGSGTAYADGAAIRDLSLTDGDVVTLFAQWDGNTYTISYELGGGVNNSANPGGYDADGAAVVLADPTRTGYSFAGWFSDAAFTARVTQIPTGSSGDKTFYAKWTPNTYTVTFSANGGTGSMGNQTFTYDSAAALSANRFTFAGRHFDGWSTTPNGGVVYTDAVRVLNLAAKGSVTLYAQWSPNSYTVAFDANGGTGAMNAVTAYCGSQTALPACTFTRAGFSFNGWTTQADGRGKAYADGSAVQDLTTADGGRVTLYAQWAPYSFGIRFNANGGSGTMANESMVQGKPKALTANKFTRTGYTFAGWNTRADGSGTAFANKQMVTVQAGEEGALVTLYAQWTANTYSVVLNTNGGQGVQCALILTYDEAATLPAVSYTRSGYRLTGWNTKSNGKGTAYGLGAEVKNLAAKGKVTLYAQWAPIGYQVSFRPNGGSGSMEDMSLSFGQSGKLTANAFTRTGYSFYGWNTRPDGTGMSYANKRSVRNLTSEDGSTVVLYAQWKANRYFVAFKANGGRGSMAKVSCFYGDTVQLPASKLTRPGYLFAGWNTQADGSGISYPNAAAVRNLSAAPGSTVTLYAQWIAQ